MTSLTFLYIIYGVSIVLLIMGMVVNAFFVIPLQIKQIEIKNGLRRLRKQMMTKGIIGELVGAIALFCLTSRFFIGSSESARYIVLIFVLAFCLFYLLDKIIDSQIYHQQFSRESLEFHKKVEILEKKREARNGRREVARVKLNTTRRKETKRKSELLNNK